MAHKQVYVCDECGAERKEANHWFVVCEYVGHITIEKWSNESAAIEDAQHLCGRECLQRRVEKFAA